MYDSELANDLRADPTVLAPRLCEHCQMSDESPPEGPSKKVSIADLLPDRKPVETSVGTLYVRHAYVSDLGEFKPGDPASVGALAIRRLTSRSSNKGDKEQLPEEDWGALNAHDINLLAPVIAKASGWQLEQNPATVERLGEAAIEGADAYRRQQEEFFERMRTSIGSSYDFLKGPALQRLQDQVSGLAHLRSSLPRNELGEVLKQSRLGTGAVREALGHIPLGGLADALKPGRTASDVVREPVYHGENAAEPVWSVPKTHLPIDIDRIRIPQPEETPIGRAAVESAEHARQMATKMEALTEMIAGLNETMVTDVLPAWFNQVKDQQEQSRVQQEQSQTALLQARDSLWWTKWAVIVSVGVTLLTAAWQVRVATVMDRDNGTAQRQAQTQLLEQLKTQQEVLKQQLSVQQEQFRQQARDAEELRRQLNRAWQRPDAPATRGVSRS